MANADMANTCSECGANLAIVGRVHRCVVRPSLAAPKADDPKKAEVEQCRIVGAGATYEYRDPEKRRAYMADYMRKRRGVR